MLQACKLVPLALPFLLGGMPLAQSFVNWESPHVHPLAMTPDGHRLLAVNTPDNRLEVFALGTGMPLRIFDVPVGLDPVSVRARTNREAWVVNHVSDTVSVVDLATRNVIATLPTDDEPADVVFAPEVSGVEGRVPAPAPRRAFVTCSQANTLLVFDVDDLAAPPRRIALRGEDPRALAVNPARGEVYAAFFESGNQTTVLAGRQPIPRPFPPKAVLDPTGPYGGVSPPPNSGAGFDPPINPALPTPPEAGLVVRRNTAGEWRDDNGGNWTALVSGSEAARSGRPVGWRLLDHDVAVIDARTLEVRYQTGLMNLCMALDVNRASGEVSVVGTDARNEVRFLQNLTGVFLRVQLGRILPGGAGTLQDLNAHLDYSTGTLAQGARDLGLADPRGIAWNAAGTRAYVSGMGSDNVIVLAADGLRLGAGTPIQVGSGPTGVVLDEPRNRLYVLNKFEASISAVDTGTHLELGRVSFFDPSPAAIVLGRAHLYDAHERSGTGVVSCASCHVDARMDRLAWDLGEPAGAMKAVDEQELYPPAAVGDWHPMKGPLLTPTLQDVIGKEPFHWRGDRDGLEEFNPLFETLLGDDEQLTAAEMQALEDYLATLHYPPNPFRNFDNSLSTSVPLPGHRSTGAFSPAGTPLPSGNAAQGKVLYSPPNLLAGPLACATCHGLGASIGTDTELVMGVFQPRPSGPNGERYHALSVWSNTAMKNAHYRNLYERTGFDLTQVENVAGFGYSPEGSVDSLARFVSPPNFQFNTDQEIADIIAFLLSVSGELGSGGPTGNPLRPPGTAGRHTHAAVGAQVTFQTGTPPAADTARLDQMIALADAGAVGLIAKGRHLGLARGYRYGGANLFQSDRLLESVTRATLTAQAGSGSELTFTVVPLGAETRLGVDRDSDGAFDRDELDQGGDPADARIKPAKDLWVPLGRRP
jgi:YVTN family beta-propeller protein